MDQLPGVLFYMNPGDPDPANLAVDGDVEVAVPGDGELVLRNLVSLGQIGVEVVLPGEPAFPLDLAVGGQGHPEGEIDHLPVEHREDSRHPQADRADMGVGGSPEAGRAATEYLGLGVELSVDLKADHGFKCHVPSSPFRLDRTDARRMGDPGRFSCH